MLVYCFWSFCPLLALFLCNIQICPPKHVFSCNKQKSAHPALLFDIILGKKLCFYKVGGRKEKRNFVFLDYEKTVQVRA